MKLGVLTSSRADYGIYMPLLTALKKDDFFDLEIIAFGTHTSKLHGFTLIEIKKHNYSKIHEIVTVLASDNPQSIATSYGLTVLKFADFWAYHKFDLVFCLGDRFEMSAAVQAGIPHRINFAHIHGGEKTLGAIDNIYRHQISLAVNVHFAATEEYADNIKKITGNIENIYSVGALSLDGVNFIKLVKEKKFRKKYSIPEGEFALVTFHPETIAIASNKKYAKEMILALENLLPILNIIITLPNADTHGSIYRDAIEQLKKKFKHQIVLVENFGKVNYFSAMKYAKLLIGNTSSGILEAASFEKYVVNVGDRQKGRTQSENIINCPFRCIDIKESVIKAISLGSYTGSNVYYNNDIAKSIIGKIKDLHK